MQDNRLKITRLELGPFGTNAYIVVCQATMESMVVDVPGEADTILSQLDGTNPRYIVITHSHFDHIGALGELKARLKIPIAAHPLDANSLPSWPNIELCDNGSLELGKLKIEVFHTPGHTPGSICLLVDKYLISGDTIFPGGPGKTGTPTAFKQLLESITTKISHLPDDTVIYPGHGVPTVLGKEKAEIAIFNSKSHALNLHGDVLWLSS